MADCGICVEDGRKLVKRQVKAEGIRFGTELRRIRLNTGLTQSQLAKSVNISTSLVSCFERGTHWPRRDTAESLDRETKASGQLLKLWVELSNRQAYPDWLGELVEAEPQATLIREHAPLVIPGLLQTQEYAHAVVSAANGLAAPAKIDEMVTTRLRRQRLWENPEPPRMMAIINEAVLLTPTGGAEVMESQLEHLVTVVKSHRIRLQVVPLGSTQNPGLAGLFTVLSFRSRADALYVEDAVSGTMIHGLDQVKQMAMLFGDLQAVALSPERSLQRLQEIKEGGFRSGTHQGVA